MSICCSDFIGQFYDFFELEASLFGSVTGQAERGKDVFGGNIADKFIACKRATAEASQSTVEAAAGVLCK